MSKTRKRSKTTKRKQTNDESNNQINKATRNRGECLTADCKMYLIQNQILLHILVLFIVGK